MDNQAYQSNTTMNNQAHQSNSTMFFKHLRKQMKAAKRSDRAKASSHRLQDQIRTAIMPWISSTNFARPRFSPTELITMVLVLHGRPMVEPQIVDRIVKIFPYYQTTSCILGSDVPDLHYALQAFELPAMKYTDGKYRVFTKHARVFLQSALYPKPKGSFPFLRLPLELRNKVYDEVLTFPQSGLAFESKERYSEAKFHAVTKDLTNCMTRPYQPRLWLADQPDLSHTLYSLSAKAALNLLLVNSQVFAEAMPCFYRTNLFYCQFAYSALNFVQLTPYPRRQHLTQLAIVLNDDSLEMIKLTLESVATLPRLRKLYIHISEGKWQRSFEPVRQGKISLVQALSVDRICDMNVEEVTFTGECPNVRAYYKKQMEKRGLQKRKRVEDEEMTGVQDRALAKRARRD